MTPFDFHNLILSIPWTYPREIVAEWRNVTFLPYVIHVDTGTRYKQYVMGLCPLSHTSHVTKPCSDISNTGWNSYLLPSLSLAASRTNVSIIYMGSHNILINTLTTTTQQPLIMHVGQCHIYSRYLAFGESGLPDMSVYQHCTQREDTITTIYCIHQLQLLTSSTIIILTLASIIHVLGYVGCCAIDQLFLQGKLHVRVRGVEGGLHTTYVLRFTTLCIN